MISYWFALNGGIELEVVLSIVKSTFGVLVEIMLETGYGLVCY